MSQSSTSNRENSFRTHLDVAISILVRLDLNLRSLGRLFPRSSRFLFHPNELRGQLLFPSGELWERSSMGWEEGTNFRDLLLLLHLLLSLALEVGLDLLFGSSLLLGFHILLGSILEILLIVILLLV